MKVLIINGSPHVKGNTYIALHEMEKQFAKHGIETEMIHRRKQGYKRVHSVQVVRKNG